MMRVSGDLIQPVMVVKEIQVPSRQPLDLRERIFDGLRIERAASFEERVLVAEVAHMRTPARYDD